LERQKLINEKEKIFYKKCKFKDKGTSNKRNLKSGNNLNYNGCTLKEIIFWKKFKLKPRGPFTLNPKIKKCNNLIVNEQFMYTKEIMEKEILKNILSSLIQRKNNGRLKTNQIMQKMYIYWKKHKPKDIKTSLSKFEIGNYFLNSPIKNLGNYLRHELIKIIISMGSLQSFKNLREKSLNDLNTQKIQRKVEYVRKISGIKYSKIWRKESIWKKFKFKKLGLIVGNRHRLKFYNDQNYHIWPTKKNPSKLDRDDKYIMDESFMK
jgi:hypothetical protein